jgi:hypothetical protein
MYVFAFIFLGYTLFVAVKYPFLSVDGWFTRGLLSLPIMQQISITALDVHPPLYYLILNAVVKALTAVNVDLILSIKIASFIPYVIIFIVSLTKVRKDYGLLAGGLFAFTLLTMCDYFTHYLTARMYSWAMLFVVLGFLYVKPIIEDNDRKSWILLSIFAVLGAYTHYFAAVTFVSLYFLLFLYVLIRNREAIKNWFISVVIGIILYAPWVLILFRQMKHVHSSYWIEPANLRLVAECFSSYMTIYPSKIIIIAAAIVLLALTILILKNYIKSKDTDDEYYLIGILAFALTIIAGTAASIVFKPILIVRYVLPATAMVWIVISIYISKLDIKKVAILLSILVLVIGAANIAYQMQDVHDLHDSMVKDMEFLKSINNNDTIVVYDGMQKYIRFHDDLNNATYFANYELNNETDKQDYVTALGLKNDSFRVPYDINKYPGKTLYLVRDHRGEVNHVNGYTMKTDHKIKNCKFIKFTKNK